jgi:hypothetical protein
VPDLNPPIHILQLNARPAAADFPAQIVPHKAVMTYMQPKVILDPARNGRLPRSPLWHPKGSSAPPTRSPISIQPIRPRKLIKLGVQVAVDGREFRTPGKILRL